VNEKITYPVKWVACGAENSIAFSVNFDPSVLTYQGAQLSPQQTGVNFVADESQAASGKIGFTISKAPGQKFTALYGWPQELALLQFSPVSTEASVSFTFGDTPVARNVSDVDSVPLGLTTTSGTLAVCKEAPITLLSDPEGIGELLGEGVFPVGSTQEIKAIAPLGWTFRLWNSDAPSDSSPFLSWSGFATCKVKVPAGGLKLTAVFDRDCRGTYFGRLDQNLASQIRVTLGANNSFSGSIEINGKTYRFRGVLDDYIDYALASTTLALPEGWEVDLVLDRGNGTLTGSLTQGDSQTDFGLTRTMQDSHEDFSWYLGKYTFLLNPNDEDPASPTAIGYGALSVGNKGVIRLVGKLGDGTAFTQSSSLLGSGSGQIYTLLYSRRGYISGNIDFESGDPTGNLAWFKPVRNKDKLYAAGICAQVSMEGSWFDPTESFIEDFSGATFNVVNANSATVYSNAITLSKGRNRLGTIVDLNNQFAWFSIDSKSGLISGKLFGVFRNSSGKPIDTPIHGAILQNSRTGGGFFFDGASNGEFDFSQ
jgi:hypothetical protein